METAIREKAGRTPVDMSFTRSRILRSDAMNPIMRVGGGSEKSLETFMLKKLVIGKNGLPLFTCKNSRSHDGHDGGGGCMQALI